MQLNKYNFLLWYDSASTTALPEVPIAYLWDREACASIPIGLPTEGMAWYMNIPEGLDVSVYNNFSDYKLRLVRADNGQVVHNDLGPLQQHFIDSPTNAFYNIYCTLVVPPAAKFGLHYFQIYDSSNSDVLFTSSYIIVRPDQETLYNTTTFCRFRHDRVFYYIKYADLPGFYQQFRLGISILERQYEGDKEVYREVTTGKQRTLQNYLGRWVRLETYYFDRSAHEAAAVMFDHDYVELNGTQYIAKNAYKEPSNPKQKFGKGEIEVWDQEFSTVNRC
jgi:hypothetical protein